MLQQLSLPNRIVFMFSAAIFLTIAAVIAYDTYSLQRAVKETYVRQLEGITTTINGRYEESHSIQDVQQTFDYIKHREDKVLMLALHGPSEKDYSILASTNREKVGAAAPKELQPSFKDGKTLIAYLNTSTDRPLVRLVAPLTEDGVTIGAIELLLDSSEEQIIVQKQLQKSIVVGITTAFLLIFVLWWFIRRLLVEPLLQLQQAAKQVEEGKPYIPTSLKGSQEIVQVGKAFNEMVNKLELRYLESITDPLTGVYNSAYFKRVLNEEMAKAKKQGGSMVLLFCDVDNFKMLNDNEGHVYGDQVLKTIAETIRNNVRSSDVVCRYGGEEFVIILPDCSQSDGLKIAEDIRQMVAIYGSHSLLTPVTISIGLAAFPKDADEGTLVHMADRAMYAAKTNGKNLVVSASELSHYKEQEYNRRRTNSNWHLNTIVSLARAVEVKDSYTHSHSEMVSRYASAIASTMGLPDEEVKKVAVAGLLHDVGKVGIPDSILNKEGKLTEEEYAIMKDHPVLGFNILSSVEEFQDILSYVLYHHERPDGKGYPEQLREEAIPLGARIIAVADAFHSMVSQRPYRKKPLTIEMAVQELLRGRGSQFDKDVVDLFLPIIDEMKEESSQSAKEDVDVK
ncbi:diguanylate cyclase [Fictibacillus iocasae]|uniref:Diguanylate cyclase n=1 Tax=Fictibacillus iocasae TaxID=2715437 RepID=A0ABW2NSK6_9BACL